MKLPLTALFLLAVLFTVVVMGLLALVVLG